MVVAEELGGADAVGEAEFFADAPEEGAGHVGGMLVEEGEGVLLRAGDIGPGIGDGEHGLFLGQCGGERFPQCPGRCGWGPFFPGRKILEMRFQEGDEFLRMEVACDGEGEIRGAEVAGVVGGEIDAVEFLQGGDGAERVEAVALAAVVGAAGLGEAAVQWIGEGFFEGGELGGFFTADGIARKGGVLDDIGKDLQDGGGVDGESGGLDEQGVVPGGGGDGGAEGLERGGNFVGRAGAGALRQHGGEELVEAVVLRCLGWQTGADAGLEMDERNPMIRQQGEVQAVAESMCGDGLDGGGGFFLRGDVLVALGIE